MLRSGVAGVEAVAAATRHSFPRHTHQQYGIGLIHQGAQKSHSGRGMVEARAGDTITVNPGEVHDGAPIGDAGRTWTMLYFDPPVIAEAARDLKESGTALCEFPRPVISDARLAGVFERLFRAMTKDQDSAAAIHREELLLMLLAQVYREQGRSEQRQTIPGAIRRAQDLIDDAPTAAVTLADLAQTSGLSRFQVLRGFARATGLTPHAYLIQRRIDLARQLIAGVRHSRRRLPPVALPTRAI